MLPFAVLFRKTMRRLIAAPLFTAFAVLSLAAGVAVTTAVYSVVDKLLLSGIGAPNLDSLAFVMAPSNGRTRRAGLSDQDFQELKDSQRTFAQLSASMAFFAPATSNQRTEVAGIEAVDPAYFRTLGLSPRLGRLIEPADEASQARVVVISADFWRNRHGADPAVLGRTIRLSGQPFEVIGVAPDAYNGLGERVLAASAWIPLASESLIHDDARVEAENSRAPLTVFGRLRADATVTTASADLQVLARSFDASRPLDRGATQPVRGRGWSATAASSHDDQDDSVRRIGFLLIGLVAMVLVVACTNLANLVLARGTARQGELAIRMAMGASRGRLIWEQSIEGILLSVFGAIAAYAMFIGVSAMMTQDFAIPFPGLGRLTIAIRPTLNVEALTVAAASMLLALVVFSLEPAVQLARTLDIRGALAATATGIRPQVGRQRMIIRWQIAVATAFFIIATMFIRATFEQVRHESGIDLDRIAVASLSFDSGWDEPRIRRAVERVLEESAKQPAIQSASASTGLPFGAQSAIHVALARPGETSAADLRRSSVTAIAVTPALFRTLGIAVVRGRAFDDGDIAGAGPVVIVSELTAKQWFGTADAVGAVIMLKRGSQPPQTVTVVGVTHDTDVGSMSSPPRPLVFLPFRQHFDRAIMISARGSGGTEAVAALREAIRRADPDIGVDVVGRGRTVLSGPFQIFSSAGRGALYLGLFTLLLSTAGLFGVQSHVVAYRTREFGVRMSLGATARQIKLMVVRDGARPVAEGLVLGLWGGIAMRLIIRSSTDLDVAVFDAWMLLMTPIPIVLAAVCACYLPAARASRVDLTTALRCE